MKSIMTDDETSCFICGSTNWIEIHHVFNSSNRKNSTKYGLVVPLCKYCHNVAPNGVHQNAENDLKLKQMGQRAFQRVYPDKDFLKIFGKNYL